MSAQADSLVVSSFFKEKRKSMTGAGGGDGAHNETASMNGRDRRPLRRLSCSLSPVDVDLELSSVQHFLVQR